jgi:hypothetical protein
LIASPLLQEHAGLGVKRQMGSDWRGGADISDLEALDEDFRGLSSSVVILVAAASVERCAQREVAAAED